jgi:Tol biopolymer transport system component
MPRRVRCIAAAAVLVAALGAGFAPLARAQSTSVNGQIVYEVCGLPSTIPFVSTQCDLFVMEADGTARTNLTDSTDHNEVSPAWSPDGTRIAFFDGSNGIFDLRLMDANGANPTGAITTTNSYPYASVPTWSPGGTQIAFVRNNPGSPVSIQADIVVIDLTTGAETTVTGPVAFGNAVVDADEIEPAWSPDGGTIAFAGVRLEQYPDPITGQPIEGAQWEIVTINPDGSGEQVISAGDRGSDRANFLEEDRAPSWSPDGSMLVFMSQDQVPSCCGTWQIWAVNRDGSAATNLTNDPTVNDLWPSWSPDGTQIVFTRFDGVGGSGLYTMPAPSALPLPAPLAAARPATALTSAAATGPVTPIPNSSDASNPDWGRRPGTEPIRTYTLSVSVETVGKGAGGTVTSTPAGIKCGRDCTEPYVSGTVVTLTAAPKKGSTFAGWSGGCIGSNRVCDVVVNDVKLVTATFQRAR